MRNYSACSRHVRSVAALLLVIALVVFLSPAQTVAEKTIIAGDMNVVRVLLTKANAQQGLSIRTTGYYQVVNAGLTLEPDTSFSIVLSQGNMVLHYQGLKLTLGDQALFARRMDESGKDGGLYIGDIAGRYEGDLQLDVIDGEIRPILHIPIEDYLMGVVPYEMSNGFPLEALKVQAIAARSYALRKRNSERAYDVTDNTNDQVYKGKNDLYATAIQAVLSTTGIVGYYKGDIALCYYAASNGGQTELIEHVWASGGEDHAYVDMRDDPYDVENPRSVVKSYKIAKTPGSQGVGKALHEALVLALSEQLEAGGYDGAPENIRIDAVEDIALSDPKFSEPSRLYTSIVFTLKLSGKKMLTTARLEGDELFAPTGSAKATATPVAEATPEPELKLSDFRQLPESVSVTLPIFKTAESAMGLSISHMKNELFTLTKTDDAFIIESRRYGHGVGMSQRGAEWMAGEYGKSYQEILAFYYPGMTFKTIDTKAANAAPLDMSVLATVAPLPSPTPRPTLVPITSEAPEGTYFAIVAHIDENSWLNLRDKPSSGADVTMQLLKDQRLLVVEELKGNWVKVKLDSVEGYVAAEYIEKE